MIYTDAQLAEAGRALAEGINHLKNKVEQLEAKPALDNMQTQWTEGQNYARYRGYGDEDLNRLENFMVQRGISSHQDAMRIAPVQPDTKGWLLNRLKLDEKNALLEQRDSDFLQLAVGRALNGE